MPSVFLFNDKTKKFEGKIDCQRDPLASEVEGKDVFLTPANTTPVEPPEEKEGFNRIWNGTEWEYKKIEKPAEPKPYEPTEYEKALGNMYDAKRKLTETDYVNDKINDALNTGNTALADEFRAKYAPLFAEREKYREDVRKWEAEVERLKPAEETASE